MQNIKLIVSYDGTFYSGWQIQKKRRTVQGELEKAISAAFGGHSRVYGASRTDAGVHAIGQTAHVKIPGQIPDKIIPKALNSFLPGDISVLRAEKMSPDFHAQFLAKRKKYAYYILRSKKRDPFLEKYTWRIPYDLSVDLIGRESRALLGKHDFSSFKAKDKNEKSAVREIYGIKISEKKEDLFFLKKYRASSDIICLTIEGNGFLYNMVRNIAGTLVDIGRGYLSEGSMKSILEKRDRTKAGPTAPPNGLFLLSVDY